MEASLISLWKKEESEILGLFKPLWSVRLKETGEHFPNPTATFITQLWLGIILQAAVCGLSLSVDV